MKVKLTKVFYAIQRAIHKPCHICGGGNAKCEYCHGTGREYRYIKLTGSSRSSKTRSAIQNFYSEAWNNKGLRLSVWRDTKKDCKDTVGEDIRKTFPTMPYYTPTSVRLHKTDSVYHFVSGSVVELCGTDDPEKVHGYNGDVLWLNEPYSISEETFDQLDQRTSMYVLFDMNPVAAHWSDKYDNHPRCKVIRSTYKDNQYCPPEQKAKIESYQPVSRSSVVVDKLISEIEAYDYQVEENPLNFSETQIKELLRCQLNHRLKTSNEYNWLVYGEGVRSSLPGLVYTGWGVCSESDFDSFEGEEVVGVDWGVHDPFGIVRVKYRDGQLMVRELNYASENEINNMLSDEQRFRNLSEENGGEGLVTMVFENCKIFKDENIVTDTNRPGKIVAARRAGWDRVVGARKELIKDGIGIISQLNVSYTEGSLNIGMEVGSYVRKKDRYGNYMEEPVDANNHLMDAIRYCVVFLKQNSVIRIT